MGCNQSKVRSRLQASPAAEMSHGISTLDLKDFVSEKWEEFQRTLKCTRIRITNNSKLGCIPDDFLRGCSQLASVDLSLLSDVKTIGHCFLCECKGLRSVDLSSLSNVTSIGDSFLYECSELESVDLTHFNNLTSICNRFLWCPKNNAPYGSYPAKAIVLRSSPACLLQKLNGERRASIQFVEPVKVSAKMVLTELGKLQQQRTVLWEPAMYPVVWNCALFPPATDRVVFSFTEPPRDVVHTHVQSLFEGLFASRGRYSVMFKDNPVSRFKLVRIELCRNSAMETQLIASLDVINRLQANNNTPSEVNAILSRVGGDPEKNAVLAEAKEIFFAQGGKKKASVCHVFHGTKVELVDSILERGLLKLAREDEGYFGQGCYTTSSIEYAARYASGELSNQGPRASDSSGCWPVIMLAAAVGIIYPVTRGEDYAKAQDLQSRSKWFGKALPGVVDHFVAPVSQATSFQAPLSNATTDYLEFISADSKYLLPVAVLWVKPSP